MNLRKYLVFFTLTILAACAESPLFKAPSAPAPSTNAAPKQVPTDSTSTSKPDIKPTPGGYYLDDGPGENAPDNLDSIPSATLKTEQLYERANKPYSALDQQFTPMTAYVPYKKQGIASWYGKRFNGKKTSTGEIYDMYAMSAAHTILPIPSYAKVTNPANGRSVIVRINDRGPFKHDRLIDLSYVAAYQLRLIKQGSGLVEVETIDTSAEAIRKISNSKSAQSASLSEGSEPNNASITAIAPLDNAVAISANPSNNDKPTKFYVQAGAFKSEVNGEVLQKKIQGLNLVENIGVANVYNGGLYRVKLGPYSSKNEADIAATNIRRQLNIAAHVTN